MTNWERRNPIIVLSKEEIENFVTDVYSVPLDRISLLEGGYSHSNYQMTFKDGTKLVLRIGNSAQDLAKEKDISELIKDRIPSPKFLKVDVTNKECQKAILSFEDGQMLKTCFHTLDERDKKRIISNAGNYLNKIHQVKFDQPGFFGADLKIFPLDFSCLDYLLESLELEIVRNRLTKVKEDKLKKFIESNAYLLSKPFETCLVHSDYNDKNILVKKVKGKGFCISSILDWEFSFAGDPLNDFGNFLRYPYYLKYRTEFASGYLLEGGKLADNWLKKAKFLDFLSMMEFLRSKAERSEVFKDVNNLIHQTITEWDKF